MDLTKLEWRVKIAVSVLRNDFDRVRLLLIRAADQNKLRHISKEWPVFYPIKNELWFNQLFFHRDKGDLPKVR